MKKWPRSALGSQMMSQHHTAWGTSAQWVAVGLLAEGLQAPSRFCLIACASRFLIGKSCSAGPQLRSTRKQSGTGLAVG